MELVASLAGSALGGQWPLHSSQADPTPSRGQSPLGGLQPLSHRSATRGKAVTGRGPRGVLPTAEMPWSTDPTRGTPVTGRRSRVWRVCVTHICARVWVTPGALTAG